MSSSTDRDPTHTADTPPRWRLIGPGLVVAATGVGAADLVATLVAGSKYGYALLWARVLGCLMKVVLVEGAGRYSLATGRTIFEGWSSLGRWTTGTSGPTSSSGASSTALPRWPAPAWRSTRSSRCLGVKAWGILSGLIGLALVWTGRYGVFEKVLSAMVLLMFVSMVGAAVLTVPNLAEIVAGLVPRSPDGGILYVLSLAGGVGGTITLAAYGYWLREKGW